VYLCTPLDLSTRLPFRRLKLNQQEFDQDQCSDEEAPTYSLQHVISGTTSIVYRSNGILVKTPLPKCQEYLENEVKVYQYLMKTDASKYIPIFHGYFGYRNTKAIIISDEGPAAVSGLEELSKESKYVFN
jgi:hypothetical protein